MIAALGLVLAVSTPAQASAVKYGQANCAAPAYAASAATTTQSSVHYHDAGAIWGTQQYGSGYHKWLAYRGAPVLMNINTTGSFTGSPYWGCSI